MTQGVAWMHSVANEQMKAGYHVGGYGLEVKIPRISDKRGTLQKWVSPEIWNSKKLKILIIQKWGRLKKSSLALKQRNDFGVWYNLLLKNYYFLLSILDILYLPSTIPKYANNEYQ